MMGNKISQTFETYDKTEVTTDTFHLLRPGDHIFWERTYGIDHHAIVECVNPTRRILHVIQNTKLELMSSGIIERKIIKVDEEDGILFKIIYSSQDVVNPADVLRRAESQIDKKTYNFCSNNCEHFATKCCIGLGKSSQVRNEMLGAGLAFLCGLPVAVFSKPSPYLTNASSENRNFVDNSARNMQTTNIQHATKTDKSSIETHNLLRTRHVQENVQSIIENFPNKLILKEGLEVPFLSAEDFAEIEKIQANFLHSFQKLDVMMNHNANHIFENGGQQAISEMINTIATTSSKFAKAALEVVKEHSGKIGVASSITIETVLAYRDIKQMHKDMTNDTLTQETFVLKTVKRSVKAAFASIGCSVGIVVGGAIGGFAAIPLAVLGRFVGSKIGSYFGSKAGKWSSSNTTASSRVMSICNWLFN